MNETRCPCARGAPPPPLLPAACAPLLVTSERGARALEGGGRCIAFAKPRCLATTPRSGSQKDEREHEADHKWRDLVRATLVWWLAVVETVTEGGGGRW